MKTLITNAALTVAGSAGIFLSGWLFFALADTLISIL